MEAVSNLTPPELNEGIALDPHSSFPLIYTPAHEDVDVLGWASRHSDRLKDQIHRHGAILFRGFGLKPDAFTALAKTICPNLFTEYGDLTPEDLAEDVYSSTVYPVEHPIHFHNESAQAPSWPLYMFFYCNRRAVEGGATRLADTRKILAGLDPAIRERFQQHPLVYSRNHYPHVDTSWQELYGVDDPREVEQRCRADGLQYAWKNRDTLQTTIAVPAVIRHPRTGEEAFFHQLFLYHPSCLDPETRRSLETVYPETDLPRMIYWHPRQRLDDGVVQAIFALYEKHAVDIHWQPGDMAMLDNALVAHGRAQFRGPRHILVAMGDMIRSEPGTTPTAEPEVAVQPPDLSQPIPELEYEPVPFTFLTMARRTPEATAVTHNGKIWTYRELEARSRQIAHALQQQGLRNGETVAVTGPRGFEVIAALLGAWMNGNVILPIDAELPRARQELMLKDASARLVLTAGVTPGGHFPCPIVELESIPECSPDSVQLPNVSSSSPAYVFFTSGTTGQPKGILGTHNGLAHFLQWQRRTFALTPDDRVAQLTSLSFDVVLRDIFLPLTSGATLCLPPENLDAVNPWPWLNSERITRLHAVPSLASVWLDHAEPGTSCSSLKTVFFAGEPLTDVLIRRWRSVASASCEVINLYGPTETTLAKCWHRIPNSPEPGVQPIGRPLPGVQILILNEQKELCRTGETGQIVIRTPYRTRGYLQPESSDASRFDFNPFRDDSGDLLYYTGDLGRYRPDGTLDILGRQDDQIKILGVRIEPQEIAAALSRYSKIRQAFVTADDGTPPSLLAYLVAAENAVSSREITAWLSGLLPAALIPHRYIYLDRLPLTPTGKVDRKALPKPKRATPEKAQTSAAPPPDIVRSLNGFWRELLKTETIGLQDRFFDLGGHSLLALQLVSRVRDQFRVGFELHHVFEHPALADMAWCIVQLQSVSPVASDQPISRADRNQPLALSFSQERLWFLSQLDPDKGIYNIPGAIRCAGPLNTDILRDGLDALVARHASLRTFFLATDGTPRQVIAEQAKLELELADISALSELERPAALRKAAQEIVHRPFDLTAAPLARARLIKISNDEHVLAYALHHTIADGWSNLIFNRELQVLYEARVNGQPAPLPALPVEYADYARWERDRFRDNTHRQIDYWEKQLAGIPARLNLPTDRPRPVAQTYNSASCSCLLPPALTRAIHDAYRGGNATLFMKLLAVFNLLLYKISGERDLCVGTPVAHRDHRELESVMGCFINTLVLRTRVSPDLTFESFLHGIRDKTLEAFAHPDAPFEKVVERLRPARDAGHHPLFQVLFNCLYFEEPTTTAEGTTLQREWLVDPETKFDMTLYIREQKNRIHLHLVYNTDLFNAQRIESLLRNYQRLVEACMASPQKRLSNFELSDGLAAERGAADASAERPPPASEINTLKATEESLTDIWRDVLGLEKVGRHDNFFALGGYSLLAVRLTARIREFFELQIPLRSVFEHPTVAGLARVIDCQQAPALPPVTPGHQGTLSLDQQRIWQIHRLGQDGHYYNVPRAVRFIGQLDPDALRSALEAVVQRHAVLHTVFEGAADRGRLKVMPSARVPFDVLDLSGRPMAEQDALERARIDLDARHRFDLTRDPPLRCTLVRRGERLHILIVTAHHIAADCWSMGLPFQAILEEDDPWHPGIFFSELMAGYDAIRNRRPPTLPPLPVQFSDFAHWERQRLETGDFENHLDYWKKHLGDAPREIQLPTDFPRPVAHSQTGRRHEFAIPPRLYEPLEAFRRNHHTTLFVPLLGAFALALHRWTGETDMVIGTPVSNRSLPETQDLIGLVGNTIATRVRLKGSDSADSLMDQLRSTVQQNHAHQSYPFTQLVKELGAPSTSRTPVFQIRFVLQHAPETRIHPPGLRLEPVKIDRGVSKYDLSLIIAVQGRKLRGWCEYNTSLFKSSTIDKFIRSYLRILEGLIRDSHPSVSGLVRSASRPEARPEDAASSIPWCFEQIVRRQPDHPALTGTGQCLTYDELNRRVNRVAHALLSKTPPGIDCVAYLIDHSPQMVIASLGILKAGKISLALHPDTPDEALRAIVADARPCLVIGSETLKDRIAAITNGICPWLTLETGGESYSDANPECVSKPDDPAVIFYTSGSTGEPKGVVKSHRTVLHRVQLYAEETRVAPRDRQSLLTYTSFATSESDVFGALLNGATLCLFDAAHRAFHEFADWLKQEQISLLHPPVLMFRRFMETLHGENLFPALRLVALAGDTVKPEDIRNWQQHCSKQSELLHRFSTTETGLLAFQRLSMSDTLDGESVPAGRPVPDKTITLIDEKGEEVAPGEPGEIVVKSRYIAEGYWRKPELTAATFTADPQDPASRVYRTGDLACFRPDGALLHLGRKDAQVKIRGYRVELREVESALLQLPAVHEAAVVAQRGNGESRLLAFVVSRPEQRFDPQALRSDLAKHLPAWKIPARFISVTTLPLTSTGKTDRLRLEQWEEEAPSIAAPSVPDGTDIEQQLAEIWRKVLNVSAVHFRDHFFNLGGDSVSAMLMLSHLEQQTGFRLSPDVLYRLGTIEEIAAYIRENHSTLSEPAIVPIRPNGNRPPLFIVHLVPGFASTSYALLTHLPADQPVYAIHPPVKNGVIEDFDGLDALTTYYADALTTFRPEGAFHLLGYSFAGRMAYDIACKLRAAGRSVAFLGLVDIAVQPRQNTWSGFWFPIVRYFPALLANLPAYLSENLLRKKSGERAAFVHARWQQLTRILRGTVSSFRQAELVNRIEEEGTRRLPEKTRKLYVLLMRQFKEYDPHPYPGRLTLFRVRARELMRPLPSDYGWGRLVAGGIEIHRIPDADHESLFEEPQVRILARALNEALGRDR